MAQSQSGKWVARVASTGGGRTYQKQRPTNFYAAIAVIVVLGLLSIVFARHQYQSGSAATTTAAAVAPAVNTITFAGLSIEACGVVQPSLAVETGQTGSLIVQPDGVIKVAPTTAAQAGVHSNVAAFASSYKGLSVSSSKLVVPANGSTAGLSYANGSSGPAGTPDAGKSGVVTITRWANFADKKPLVTSDPTKAKLSANALVTIAFAPKGTAATKPASTTVQAVIAATQKQAAASATTTTTAASAATTTTIPVTTTTTASTTTTTKK